MASAGIPLRNPAGAALANTPMRDNTEGGRPALNSQGRIC